MTIKIFTPLALLAALICSTGVNAQDYASNSKLATGQWYKIPVTATGIYRITTTQVPALKGTSINRIGLYGIPGGQLSYDNSARPYDDMVACNYDIHDANNNGLFDDADYLLFYGEGPSVWRYSQGDQRFEYQMNVWATTSCYFLCLGSNTAHSMPIANVPESSAKADITTFTGVAVVHEDKTNTHNTGQIWVADKFTSSLTERTYTLTIPNMVTNAAISTRYAYALSSVSPAQFTLKYNSDEHQHTIAASTNYQIFSDNFTARSNASITLTCTFTPHESNAAGYLDFIEFNAPVSLTYSSGQLIVRNDKLLGSESLRFVSAAGYKSNLQVWDVTDPCSTQKLNINATNGNGFYYYASTEKAGTHIIFTPDAAYTPTGITSVKNQNIHGSEMPDFVIVTHEAYRSQAERLADLHRLRDGMTVLVVSQEEVFNEYSSGRPDPVAIRQMMRGFMKRAEADSSLEAPRYLMLFGKGTFDNRNILGSNLTSVITYQTPTSFDSESATYATDDVFGYLGDLETEFSYGQMDIGIGRLPAQSAAEADHLVDKIERYMDHSDLKRSDIRGDWRNVVCLLADDADPSCELDTQFVHSSEMTAAKINSLYPRFNVEKIYADAYVQQSGADGSYYPDVNNALQRQINYGALVTNYVGHGAAQYIGTERFLMVSDMEHFTNTDQLTFFITSTCTFGRYDLVEERCGAEEFLLAPAAGIGLITASRPISHLERFNTDCVTGVLNPENTVGDALRIAKNRTSTSHAIILLGDPAMRLSHPASNVAVTHVNNHAVDPSVTDSAKVLSRVTIKGEIRNPDGTLNSGFNGTVYPIVYDRPTKSRTLANDNDSTEVNFVQQKNVLYKGREKVQNGKFEYSFVIPRDVSFNYDYAKLSHYARSEEQTDAAGQYGNIMFGGFDEHADIREVHPLVELYLNDSSFRNGGLTNETPTLFAHLSDSVGINAAGSGLGHDITAVIDGNSFSTVNLNDLFEPDILDSRNGSIRYTLGKLDDGPHTLTLKCWNIFNYSGSATISFYVANDRNAQIGTFATAPNPAHDRTTFRIEHNQPGNIESAVIDIYNMRGGLVRHIELAPAQGSTLLTYQWDFTSPAGSLLPRGIYTARTTITTSDGKQLSEVTKVVRN